MRYWLFQNNQVVGPHDRDELASVAGFCAESLVCPEGRKGTQMGDWQRAGVISELAEVLLKTSKVPAAVIAGSGQGLLPPEPTLRDLAILGSLQEKLTLLESVISQLQDDLRARTQDLTQIKVDYELKSRESELLKAKLDDMEKRLAQAELLKEAVAKSQVQEQAIAQTQVSQAAEIEKVSTRLELAQEDLQRQVSEIRRRSAEPEEKAFKAEAAPPPAAFAPAPAAPPPMPVPMRAQAPAPVQMPPPAPAPEPSAPFGFPAEEPAFGAEAAAPMEPPRLEPPSMDFMPQAEPPAAMPGPGTMPYQGEMPGPAPLELPTPGAEPQPLVGFAEVGAPQQTLEAPAAMAPAAAQRAAELSAAPAKKKGKGGTIAVVVLLVASAAAGAAHYLGLLDSVLGKKKPAPAPEPQASVPMEPPKRVAPDTVKTGLEDKSQAAIDFTKSYIASGDKQTLAERLEGPNPAPGLSPWTVDHVADARYTVSYYDRSTDSKTPRYRFDVRLDMKTLNGLDQSSQDILKGGSGEQALMTAPSPAAPEKPKHRKRRPAKGAERQKAAAPKEEAANDTLGSMLSEPSLAEEALSDKPAEPAPPRKEEKAQKAAPEAKPQEQAKTEEAPAPAKKSGKSAKKPKEDMSLDELLLPGVPKQQ